MEPKPKPLARTTSANILQNKYELGKLLGRGSFAKVYAARCLSSSSSPPNRLVAIKIIDKTATDVSVLEPRIVSEVHSMKRLENHPNILKIHEVMASKTKIYLVMELASGGDLFSKILQRGKMKESVARKYFRQLVSALNFCHQNGVVHRDVKPQNLLLDEKGNLKVSDFGLSALKQNASGLVLQTACGTPAFTAPEVFARKGYDGAKADAWSCGVILFFLLTGSLPFEHGNLATLYKKIHERDFEIPSWVSRPARSVINALIDPNPGTRMSLERVMNHHWFTNKCSELGSVDSSVSMMELDKYGRDSGSGLNAFGIISMSSGLDLSGLFEEGGGGGGGRERRFTSGETVERVIGKVREVGGRLGYRVVEEEGKGGVGAIGLGKGRIGLMFKALEIAERLLMVEVKAVVVGGGGRGCGAEVIEDSHWGELKDGLGDVVLQWHY